MPLIQEYNKLYEQNSNIKKICVNGNVVWPTAVIDPKTIPFSVRNMESTSIEFPIDPNYSYSIVDGEWFVPYEVETITLDPGEKMRIRWAKQPRTYVEYTTFPWPSNSIRINIGGNIMSLLDGEYFVEADTVEGSAFDRLFASKRVDLDDLVLPATTLGVFCYRNMFQDCTSLTTAPALPATTVAIYCYEYMFSGCTSLTTAPALPATTLDRYCYQYMFNGCTSLTTAPVLPATTLTVCCYQNMFYGCTSLNTIKCIATSGINVYYSTYNWLYNVSSTGTFTKAAGVTWPTGTSGIPEGWTVVEV